MRGLEGAPYLSGLGILNKGRGGRCFGELNCRGVEKVAGGVTGCPSPPGAEPPDPDSLTRFFFGSILHLTYLPTE